ncbi:MAG: DnaJ C-terminal domain-containing protein [Hyphomicrobiales bacterium]|nr:DnaJ domain-containing protein [Alphaproteobacteria bacterium]
MRDPYDVLGVQKNATPAAVKSAFRRLAKKLHPDANKADKTAAAKFSELNSAYEILGDEAKRKAFDRGEIDGEGKPRFQQGFGGGPGGGHRGPWGAGGGAPGQDGGFESFTWGPGGAQRGGARRGGFRGSFGGGGGIDDILKEMMGGAGRQFEPEEFGGAQPSRDVTGTVAITLPEVLTGTSRRVHLPTGKEIDVKIPPGMADGQTIRLKGQGLPGHGGAVGDALITVTFAEHPMFKRDGANLRLELPVTLYEAVLGGKVRVPTLDGAVELAIPRGTSSGRTMRVKGKGLPAKDGAGDMYVTIRIVLPETGDAELDELMKKWRDGKPYDPRRDIS